MPTERELASLLLAAEGDDARVAVAALEAIGAELRLAGLRVRPPEEGAALGGLHPTRSARILSGAVPVGVLGEIDPEVAEDFGIEGRLGWLELDLGILADRAVVPRRDERTRPISRFPSSDIDLALVVADPVPADEVADVLGAAGGELLESVTLFDVYRGPGLEPGRRSLAFRLRFCAPDRTLTDREVGALRAACVEAAQRQMGAVLR